MKIWTATTDGDNCDLTTTVHLTEVLAQNRVLNDLSRSGVPVTIIPPEAMNDTNKLVKLWEAKMDGSCIIQAQEVAAIFLGLPEAASLLKQGFDDPYPPDLETAKTGRIAWRFGHIVELLAKPLGEADGAYFKRLCGKD